jgi:hypothetical protein
MITKLNTKQFEAANQSELKGVTLVYKSTNKDGETHESAVNFAGEGYTPANNTQDEIFKSWKNVIQTFWSTKMLEAGLRTDNGGIATKLRNTTPAAIVVRTNNGKTARRWDVEASIWQRIGIVPTKRDMEEANRDYKKKMFKAAKASFDALQFRAQFDDALLPELEVSTIVDDEAAA